MKRVIVAGVRASGEGYPNAEGTQRLLRAHAIADVVDVGEPLQADTHLWQLGGKGVMAKWRLFRLFGLGTLKSALRAIRAGLGQEAVVYIPYPAVPLLILFRCIPHRWRPRCVADAYISLWDSAFNDRRRGVGSRRLAATARAVEGFALRGAWRVLVDTEANRAFFIEHFGLRPDAVISMPLSIAMERAAVVRAPVAAKGLRVTFVGTFVPLQGVESIIAAARILRAVPEIEIELIGDGQGAERIAEEVAASDLPNLHWIRRWMPMSEIAKHVDAADVCLGVFGGSAKASRVTPFKVYYALARGKPVVTQGAMSLPSGVPPLPVISVASDDTEATSNGIASALLDLLASPDTRSSLARAAADHFDAHLSAACIASRWSAMLEAPDME